MQATTYILASERYGNLYIGVTSDLKQCIYEHKRQFLNGYSQEHNVTQLVYFETHPDMCCAMAREKQLMSWRHTLKVNLIDKVNPQWDDLYYCI